MHDFFQPVLDFWPLITAFGALIILGVKMVLQVKLILADLDGLKPQVVKLTGLPERLEKIELKIEHMTPRIAEVRRLRDDVDAIDEDMSDVRDAMLSGRVPVSRRPRHRTPPTGSPPYIPPKTPTDDEGDPK